MDARGGGGVVHEPPNAKFEFTPTWIVAVVSSIIVLISFSLERGLHHLGQLFKRKHQRELNHALLKLKEELMILGFISLLLNLFQGAIGLICMPKDFAFHMLPCKRTATTVVNHFSSSTFLHDYNTHRRLLSTQTTFHHCRRKGKVPLLSLEALHQLHIFIFVLAIVHVVFCVTTMLLANIKITRWKRWEKPEQSQNDNEFEERAQGYWKNAAIIAWMVAFVKQFHGSITESDYTSLRRGFITKHCRGNPDFNFHEHITKSYRHDFKKVVGISWYLWVFVVLFLLLNLEGWHTYFWLSFLPLIMVVLVGAKLEYIITRMAQELNRRRRDNEAQEEEEEEEENYIGRHRNWNRNMNIGGGGGGGGGRAAAVHEVKPSDEHFWFAKPSLVLVLIHFILFQNSFEIAFFFWIWTTYGFRSCIMDQPAFIITRLFLGAIVQVLCSYSTLPLYSLVTQLILGVVLITNLNLKMGSEYKRVESKATEENQMSEAQRSGNT